MGIGAIVSQSGACKPPFWHNVEVINLKIKDENLSLRKKAYILILVPLVFQIIFVAVLAFLLNQAERDVQREAHSRNIAAEANSLLRHFIEAATAVHAYKATRFAGYAASFERVSQQIPDEILVLKRLMLDDPKQQDSLARVEALGRNAVEVLSRAKILISKSNDEISPFEAISIRKDLETNVNQITRELSDLIEEQKALQRKDVHAEERSRWLVVYALLGFVALNILVAIGLASYFNRGTSTRLEVLMDNTSRLARGEKLTPPLAGRDEIGHLDHVFHDMADALEKAARHKQELIAMVSHDLRTPLTSVQASLTLLSEGALGDLTPRVNKEVRVAENNTSRLINLINDLLDIERMEAGKLEMYMIEARVDDIFEQAIDTVGKFAEQQGIAIVAADTNLTVFADADRIVQVLVNLISNAVKFSPRDTTIRLDAMPLNESIIEVTVQDHGRGIPLEQQEAVFQRFQQVSAADAKGRKGTGLGLAICKAIIDGHGGRIGVRSAEGQGSTFFFTLPVKRPT